MVFYRCKSDVISKVVNSKKIQNYLNTIFSHRMRRTCACDKARDKAASGERPELCSRARIRRQRSRKTLHLTLKVALLLKTKNAPTKAITVLQQPSA